MARVESLLERLMERIPQGQFGDLTPSSIPVTVDEPPALFVPPPENSRDRTGVGSAVGKLEILRQPPRMLPTQADVDCPFSSSHG